MDFSILRNLRRLSVRESMSRSFPRLPSRLRHFDFGGCFFGDQYNGESEENIRNANLTDLNSLLLPAALIDWNFVQTLVEPCKGNIQILNLSCLLKHVGHNPPELLLGPDHLKSLVELDVSSNHLKDSFFEHIADSCPRLRSLNTSHNNTITGVGVKALIMKPGDKLKKLNLNRCSRVGVDAVQLARTNGVEVEYSFPDDRLIAKQMRMAP